MRLSRRDFIKLSGGTAGSLVLVNFLDTAPGVWASPQAIPLEKRIGEKTTICPYCAVGCGMIVASAEGKITNIEGDPDNPINRGALCSKGSALFQVANNDRRLKKVLYRAPGASSWVEKDWDWALGQIATKIKATRDKGWIAKDKDGYLVNRTEPIASLGGSAQNNEECYLISKAMRALGLVFIEHEARLCHSSTVTALGESFGRGAMTNHWNDIANSDCIMIIGSNAAEQHPISFKWVTAAMEKGAKLINVDPRFTRTSSKAHLYAPIRPGTDTAFIGGMIKYVLDDMEANPPNYNMEANPPNHNMEYYVPDDIKAYPSNYNMEYVREYTNASILVDPGYSFEDGLFSGYDPSKRSYDKATWGYQLDGQGIPKRDKTLKDPQCVFQLLKKFYSRYDVDTVCAITGTPKDIYLQVCRTFAATGAPGKVGTIMYSMGATQHTNACQMIRAYSILQTLLGNMGLAGGGINAMRGESNVQGSTDQALLFHLLPGYLKPARNVHDTLDKYFKANIPVSKDPLSVNWLQHYPKYFVSLQKAWWGQAATKDNEFAFRYLPKISADYSWISLFEAMDAGTVKGLLVLGMNPAVSSPNLAVCHRALGKLDWMVVADLWETETATFWKRPGVNPADVKTEVFLLPAAASVEKEGSVTNSSRLAQWRYLCGATPGEARSDLEIVNQLMLKLKELYKNEGGPLAEAITGLTWDYGTPADPHRVAKEINGYDLATGDLMANFVGLKDDGSTSCGNWIYSGCYTQGGNMMARRDPADPSGIGLHSGWAWCWPLNRRILYNRASVDLQGRPWDERHPVVMWDPVGKKWTGDVIDGAATKGPAEAYPFIMLAEGQARLFGGFTLTDGPLPEHYEPWESPIENPMSSVQNDPTVRIWRPEEQGTPDKYPVVCSTFRVTEHWQAGAMTRNFPWLVELQPEMFIEMGEELAAEKAIKNGERVIVETTRGKIEALALVTRRFRPFRLNGRVVHQIGMPWHWGFAGLSTGDSANMLTPHIGDANTMIPEYKAFLCNVRKA